MRHRHHWTPAQLAYLREHYAETRTADIAAHLGLKTSQVYWRAHLLGLHKSIDAIARMAREQMANPNHPGRRTVFAAGMTPWNKGKPYSPPGSEATRFRPGQLNGRAKHL